MHFLKTHCFKSQFLVQIVNLDTNIIKSLTGITAVCLRISAVCLQVFVSITTVVIENKINVLVFFEQNMEFCNCVRGVQRRMVYA